MTKLTNHIIMLRQTASVMFNNRDYHGVDASPRLQYTVRCDGQFTPEICEKLKLKDNLIFDYSYVK